MVKRRGGFGLSDRGQDDEGKVRGPTKRADSKVPPRVARPTALSGPSKSSLPAPEETRRIDTGSGARPRLPSSVGERPRPPSSVGERPRQLTDKTVVPRRPTTGARRRGPPGGTLMQRLGGGSLPAPVELRHVTGQHELTPDLRKVAGRYVLGQELGRGGMGVVRLVKDLDVGREVAMKTLVPDDPDAASLVQPLIQEAQTTGQLEHPNIIPVYELGVLPNGDVFYTMKAVGGSSLKDILRGLRAADPETLEEYTLRRLLNIFGQICLALHYAHSRGVVHRDLKPDNVLLGSYGEVLVMDWGIAYVTGKKDDPLARQGMVVGTPHYMSPEQSRGEIDQVDARSDIFSLGVMLYEILTLQTPIMESNTDLALEAVQMYRGPKRPVPTDEGARPVPGSLADIVERAMAADPDDRYPNARMLYDHVETYLEGDAERERLKRMSADVLGVGVQALDNFMHLKRSRDRLAQRIRQRGREVHRWDSQAVKRDLWDLKARHQHMELVLSQAFSTAVNHFNRVLGLVPDQAQAMAALANLYWTRFEAAEEVGDYSNMIYLADRVLKFNDPSRGGPLRGGSGRITVRSFPQGADIILFDFTKGVPDTRLESGRLVGPTPVSDVELPMGIYLLVAHKEGYRDAHQPIFVRPGLARTYLLSLKPWAAQEKLVGRTGELATIRYNFERSMAGRQIRRVLVSGSDGIGKNRILGAFNDYLEGLPEGVLFFFAECHEQHSLVPYAPITEALRIRSGVVAGNGLDVVHVKLRTMIEAAVSEGGPPTQQDRELIDQTASVLARLPGMASAEFEPDLEPAETRERFDRALVDFVRLVTRWDPAVFVFQEVEYIDDASARVIRRANHFLGDSPVFILGLGSDVVHQAGWDERIHLKPLSESAVDALLRDVLKGRLPDGLHAYVMARSAGIPWLVTDTIRRLAERFDLYSADGHWYLKDGLPPPIPITMYEARRQMVEELPDHLSDALRAASVIGDVFWSEALSAMGVESPDHCLAELTEREFIRAQPDTRYPNTHAYAFRSLLFREIVYDSIDDPAELARLHEGLADWIRDRFRNDVREVAELALHVELARDEAWAALLFGQLGDACRYSGCFGMARECYQRALTNTVEPEDRAALEQRLESVKGQR